MRLRNQLVSVAKEAHAELIGCVVGHLNGTVPLGVGQREAHRVGCLAPHNGVILEELVGLLWVDGDAHQRSG